MSRDDFGGRRGRGFDPNDIPWDQISKRIGLVMIGLAVAAVLLAGWSSFYRVEASDEGVVLRFGRKIATVPPGLHMKMPWPIDTVYLVPVQRIQSLEFGFETTQAGRETVFASQTTDDRINGAGGSVRNALVEICKGNGVPGQSCGENSLFHVYFSEQPVSHYRDTLSAVTPT
ncbi:MAG: hypothetical protein H8E37_10805, partial [Planctomycetes bacterium]|nr:hypothetical protein [Planctomycetota bacterium]